MSSPADSTSAPASKSAGLGSKLGYQLLTCVIGTAGGWAGDALGVPLGWMVGAMVATGICAASGLKIMLPPQLRWLVLSVIGVYLGASFSPDVLSWLSRSAITVVVMCAMVALVTLIASVVMVLALKCNAVTAVTSCVPGGFSTMVLLAGEHGGDEKVVAIVQLVRMIMVIGTISLLARFSLETEVVAYEQIIQTRELGYAGALALAGLLIGVLAKMPIMCMFVPMAAGAFLQLGSFTHLILPSEPLAVALVVLGTSVGVQWKNFRGEILLKCLLTGFVLGLFLISVAYGTAVSLAHLLELDLLPTVLALAPGGVAEISLISVALNIEPSFVVLHHLLRVVFILLCLPFVFAAIAKKITNT